MLIFLFLDSETKERHHNLSELRQKSTANNIHICIQMDSNEHDFFFLLCCFHFMRFNFGVIIICFFFLYFKLFPVVLLFIFFMHMHLLVVVILEIERFTRITYNEICCSSKNISNKGNRIL